MLAGNQSGACELFPSGKKMCRGEETRLLRDQYMPYVGLALTGCCGKEDALLGDTGLGSGRD
jgi:hypothetical protein